MNDISLIAPISGNDSFKLPPARNSSFYICRIHHLMMEEEDRPPGVGVKINRRWQGKELVGSKKKLRCTRKHVQAAGSIATHCSVEESSSTYKLHQRDANTNLYKEPQPPSCVFTTAYAALVYRQKNGSGESKASWK